VLILNKKSISNHESQLFQSELEKFRPHCNRILQAHHKQTALMKELTRTYGVLLQDKRVKSEQVKYESFNRQQNYVLTKYKKVFQAFKDLIQGLRSAQSFYSEMKDTVESLEKNEETFVNNRRAEGAQLLHRIEQDKASSAGGQADRERDRLQQLMERMSVASSSSPTKSGTSRPAPLSRTSHSNDPYSVKPPPISPPYYSKTPSSYGNGPPTMKSPASAASFQSFPQPSSVDLGHQTPVTRDSHQSGSAVGNNDPYNPMAYPFQSPAPPPPLQQKPDHQSQQYPQQQKQYLPQGYVPPPPPPGPPPSPQGNFGNPGYPYPSGPGGYAYNPPPRKSSANQPQADPWAGLNAWK